MNDDVILELLIGIQKFFLTVILLLLQGADLPAKELDSLLQLLGEKKRKDEHEQEFPNSGLGFLNSPDSHPKRLSFDEMRNEYTLWCSL